ncbi:MAG: hypothetical protein V4683_15585 [Bacteroidota bacterium]
MQTLYEISGYIQYAIWLILLYLAFQKRWFWKAYYRFFYFYLAGNVVLLFFQIISTYTPQFKYNNQFFGYIFTPFEFVTLGLFLKDIINEKLISKYIIFSNILFIIFNAYNAFWGEGYLNPNSTGIMIENLYLIALSLWSFTVLFKEVDFQNIYSKPVSWFVLGILLYFTTSILASFVYDLAIETKNDNLLYPIVIIPNFLNSIYLMFYLKGIKLIERPSYQ